MPLRCRARFRSRCPPLVSAKEFGNRCLCRPKLKSSRSRRAHQGASRMAKSRLLDEVPPVAGWSRDSARKRLGQAMPLRIVGPGRATKGILHGRHSRKPAATYGFSKPSTQIRNVSMRLMCRVSDPEVNWHLVARRVENLIHFENSYRTLQVRSGGKSKYASIAGALLYSFLLRAAQPLPCRSRTGALFFHIVFLDVCVANPSGYLRCLPALRCVERHDR